jgi:hypothetical protein
MDHHWINLTIQTLSIVVTSMLRPKVMPVESCSVVSFCVKIIFFVLSFYYIMNKKKAQSMAEILWVFPLSVSNVGMMF